MKGEVSLTTFNLPKIRKGWFTARFFKTAASEATTEIGRMTFLEFLS